MPSKLAVEVNQPCLWMEKNTRYGQVGSFPTLHLQNRKANHGSYIDKDYALTLSKKTMIATFYLQIEQEPPPVYLLAATQKTPSAKLA